MILVVKLKLLISLCSKLVRNWDELTRDWTRVVGKYARSFLEDIAKSLAKLIPGMNTVLRLRSASKVVLPVLPTVKRPLIALNRHVQKQASAALSRLTSQENITPQTSLPRSYSRTMSLPSLTAVRVPAKISV